VEINLGEYGVVFGETRKPRPNGSVAMSEAVWFQPREVRALAAVRPAAPQTAVPAIAGTRHIGGSTLPTVTDRRWSRMSNAAESLKRALANTRGTSQAVEDGDHFAQAIGRQLERRGIAKVPGLPSPEPEPEWYDAWIELDRQHKELEAEREARRPAEAEAAQAPQTTAGILAAEITKAATNSNSAHIPLNGAQVLRTALSSMGGSGTINGQAE
jgi:hypothetical protein